MSERIPRLQMEAMPAVLAAALRPRVDRLGYLGEFFQCAANVPEALLAFQRFTEALKQALPERVTEVVALTVAARLGNDYERHQHERLCRALGYDDAWIRGVTALQPGVAALDAVDRAVQALVLRVIERQGHEVAAELDAVVDALGAAPAMAVLLSIGRYVTHSVVVNALALAPPVASLFDEV
ncbi:MAG: carboxymuconolactone decarboxylase family protein [Candidatus Binatia bacterium]